MCYSVLILFNLLSNYTFTGQYALKRVFYSLYLFFFFFCHKEKESFKINCIIVAFILRTASKKQN